LSLFDLSIAAFLFNFLIESSIISPLGIFFNQPTFVHLTLKHFLKKGNSILLHVIGGRRSKQKWHGKMMLPFVG
jgi:hypothetical protein